LGGGGREGPLGSTIEPRETPFRVTKSSGGAVLQAIHIHGHVTIHIPSFIHTHNTRSYTHTHSHNTHMHSHTRTSTHTHTHAHFLSLTRSLALSRSLSLSLSCAHMHTCIHTQTHTNTHTHTHAQTHTHTHTHTPTHTHAHKYAHTYLRMSIGQLCNEGQICARACGATLCECVHVCVVCVWLQTPLACIGRTVVFKRALLPVANTRTTPRSFLQPWGCACVCHW